MVEKESLGYEALLLECPPGDKRKRQGYGLRKFAQFRSPPLRCVEAPLGAQAPTGVPQVRAQTSAPGRQACAARFGKLESSRRQSQVSRINSYTTIIIII